jgi:P-type Cu+ transporter
MDRVTDAILVNNLHCSSCVNTVENVLNELDPKPLSVNVSIVSQTVTVEHTDALTLDRIQDALVQAGFDISQSHIPSNYNVSSLPDVLRRRRQRHLENCLMCRDQESSKTLRSMLSDPTLAGSHRTQSKQDTSMDQGPFHATYSVGGMTCASCSNTITHQLSQMDGLSNVVVNLMGHSMTLTASNRTLVNEVASHVEDLGYEAQLVEAKPFGTSDEEEIGERTVSIKVDGMFCEYVVPFVRVTEC